MNRRLEYLRRRRADVISSIIRRERQERDIGGRLHAYARIERALYRLAEEERSQ